MAANFLGRISSILLAVIFTPYYIHVLGMEGYGLIGFYITLHASIGFLEMGLSRACNRELSRYSGEGSRAYKFMRDTLRSIEAIYWAIALIIGIGLSSLSQLIASSWLSTSYLSQKDLAQLIIIIAWIIALRWPSGVYIGALMGLQKQVKMNVVQTLLGIINWGGSALVLWLIRPDLYGFFYWQIFVSVFSTSLFVWLAWREMPQSEARANFSKKVLREIFPFVTGVGANAILGTLLRQADKLLLSAMLPLKQFAYYALATVIANVIALIADAVSNATFPRFSQLVGTKEKVTTIIALYRFGTQAVASLIVPISLAIAFFSYEFLYVYTNSHGVAQNASPILSVLVIAKMLHSSMMIPYAVQLAYGWTRMSVMINAASLALLLITIPFLVNAYGAVGAAISWLCVTLVYVLVGMPLMHKKLLIGELRKWFENSLLRPAIAVGVFLFVVSWVGGTAESGRWMTSLQLIGVFSGSVIVAILSLRELRIRVVEEIKRGMI